MQNPRQQAYFYLIDLLLNGPCIQEQEILDAQQELLDEGLVTAAFAMAELGATTRIYEPLLLSVHSILGSRGLANGL
jgi:hypothetical protein